jgi:hypothetical protein
MFTILLLYLDQRCEMVKGWIECMEASFKPWRMLQGLAGSGIKYIFQACDFNYLL